MNFKNFPFQVFEQAQDPTVEAVWGSDAGGDAASSGSGSGGDGGTPATPSAHEPAGGSVPQTQQGKAATPATPATPQVAQPSVQQTPAFDETRLIEIATRAAQAGMEQRQQQQPPAQRPQPTQADIRQSLAYYEADQATLGEILGVEPSDITPERVQKFNAMVQGIVRQSVTMAAAWTQKTYGPHIDAFKTQQTQQFEQQAQQEFLTQFPALNNPNYRELVVTTKDAMLASGRKWPTREAFIKDLGTKVTEVLTKVSGRAPGAQQAPQQQQQVKRPATGMTGGGAGGSSSTPPNTDPSVLAVWGPKKR